MTFREKQKKRRRIRQRLQQLKKQAQKNSPSKTEGESIKKSYFNKINSISSDCSMQTHLSLAATRGGATNHMGVIT